MSAKGRPPYEGGPLSDPSSVLCFRMFQPGQRRMPRFMREGYGDHVHQRILARRRALEKDRFDVLCASPQWKAQAPVRKNRSPRLEKIGKRP